MKSNTEPLQPDTYYHIYNRGINKEDLFKEDRNYHYFLIKYKNTSRRSPLPFHTVSLRTIFICLFVPVPPKT